MKRKAADAHDAGGVAGLFCLGCPNLLKREAADAHDAGGFAGSLVWAARGR